MKQVVDYFAPHDLAFMQCLARNGYVGIARYLTSSMNDARQITAQEVADAHEAGLEVHFFYEMNPTYPGYFTFAQGAEDCRQAVERLRELGAPDGTVVYLSVDAPATRIPVGLLDDYFSGVESMQTPQITPGLYGFEAHVEHARANYPNVGKHLAQTYGTPRGLLDLWQHEQVALCGVAVDLDDCTVNGWAKEDEDVALRDEFEKFKTDTEATIKAMKETYNPLYHHIHLIKDPDKLKTEGPLVPPVEGAKYAGESADDSEIMWMYPDGVVRKA